VKATTKMRLDLMLRPENIGGVAKHYQQTIRDALNELDAAYAALRTAHKILSADAPEPRDINEARDIVEAALKGAEE
jgi:hypothetical protein